MNPHYQQREKSGETAAINFIPNRSSSRFSTSPTNGSRLLSRVKVGTHSPSSTGSHTRAYTAKQGLFRVGVVSLPSASSARSRTSPGRVSERRTLPLLGLGRMCSRRTQKACGTAMRSCASLSRRCRGPAGLRDLFLLLPKLRLLRSAHTGPFRVCEAGVVSLPSARFARCRNAGRPLAKTTCLPFSEVDGHCSPRDAYFLANIPVSLSAISVANVFALWYDKSHKSGLSEMRVSQNNRKGKNAEQMLHDANDAKELSDDWNRAKDLCYDYNQLRPSKELFAL